MPKERSPVASEKVVKDDRPFDTKKSVSEALEEDRPSLIKSSQGRSTLLYQKSVSEALEEDRPNLRKSSQGRSTGAMLKRA